MTEPTGQPGWQQPLNPKEAKAQAKAAEAYSKAQSNWFVRHKILTAIGAVIVIAIIAQAAGGGGGGGDKNNANDTTGGTTTSNAPATTTTKPAAVKPNSPDYPGKKAGDKVVSPGQSVNLSGWTTTATALKYRTLNQFSGRNICTTVTMTNRDSEQQEYSPLSWKLQTPNGGVQDMTFTGEDNELGSEGLAPGGKVTKLVCFDDKKAGKGLYILSWQPDIFSNGDRGVWLNRL